MFVLVHLYNLVVSIKFGLIEPANLLYMVLVSILKSICSQEGFSWRVDVARVHQTIAQSLYSLTSSFNLFCTFFGVTTV